MVSTDPIVELQDVTFSYGGTPVLANASLRIEAGDSVCVIGPNGGGKTTLIKLILGILSPQRGQVRVFGVPAAKAGVRIGYMPQHVHLDPQFPVTALEVVLMGRLGKAPRFGPYRRHDKEIARAALRDVNVENLAARPLSALSGGQRQRVLIARALASEPEMLVLDEPTSNLDPAVQEELYDLLRELNKRFTLVVVSHDVGFVSVFFRSVVCVHRHVHVHPSSDLTDKIVADMYGRRVRLVHPAAQKAESAG